MAWTKAQRVKHKTETGVDIFAGCVVVVIAILACARAFGVID